MLNTLNTKNSQTTVINRSKPQVAEAKSEAAKADQEDSFIAGGAKVVGGALADGGMYVLKATGNVAGRAAMSVGNGLLGIATRLASDTAIMGGAAVGAATLGAIGLVLAGPAVGLGLTAALGAGAGILHQVVAPEHPEDVGLSPRAKAHNRMVDSVAVGGLTTCAALVGLGQAPFIGAGIVLAGITGAVGGAIGSVINQTGEALGLLKGPGSFEGKRPRGRFLNAAEGIIRVGYAGTKLVGGLVGSAASAVFSDKTPAPA